MAQERTPSARALAEHIQEDLGFQLRTWRVQRLGWWGGVLILVAAVLGLFGHGLFSVVEARSADGAVRVVFERLARHGVPTEIEVQVAPQLITGETVTIWFERQYLDGIRLGGIFPEPSAVRDAAGRTGYEFEVADVGSEGFDLTLQLEYDDVGPRRGSVAVEGGPSVRLEQFVYP